MRDREALLRQRTTHQPSLKRSAPHTKPLTTGGHSTRHGHRRVPQPATLQAHPVKADIVQLGAHPHRTFSLSSLNLAISAACASMSEMRRSLAISTATTCTHTHMPGTQSIKAHNQSRHTLDQWFYESYALYTLNTMDKGGQPHEKMPSVHHSA